jgi:tetratricopeptide (TPR) repeat protein
MKKIFLTVLGVLLMAAPAAAQVGGVRVDVNKLRSAIAKSDSDIANPKNASKASVWLKRGETLIEVDAAPVSGLYAGMPENMLKLAMGDATASEETLGDTTFTVYNYEHVKVYMANGVVDFFVPITVVQEGALDMAYEALDRAYQLDNKTARKVGDNLGTIRTKSSENGTSLYSIGERKNAANEFRRAFMVSNHPTSPAVDTMSLYYAGMAGAYGDDYENAIRDLDQVLQMGYENNGETYRLKFFALYNLNRRPEALQVLETGISRYPGNEELIDMMMRYYAENEGDPSSMIPLVEEAIAKNPNNPVLYQGLARIYNKLGRFDESISTIQKAVQLAPEDFLSNYLEGFFIVTKGDQIYSELGKQQFSSSNAFQTALAAVNNVFRSAIAPLERALALNETEIATVELLKNITARLREEEGMQAKFDKYTELFNSMDAQ